MLPVTNSALIPVTNSAVIPVINPAGIPVTNSAVIPVTNSALIPVINPALIPVTNSAVIPVINPAVIPVTNSALIPVINPAVIAAFGEYARAMQPMRNTVARIAETVAPFADIAEVAKSMASCVRVVQVATPAVLREGTQMQPGLDREQAAPIAPMAGSLVALAAPVPSGKQNRGNRSVRPGTMAAALALGIYISSHSYNSKLTASALAQFAANFAAREGLKGADLLIHRGSTMLTMAEAFLNAWKATSKVAAQNQKVAAH
jgi:hypothetical protein